MGTPLLCSHQSLPSRRDRCCRGREPLRRRAWGLQLRRLVCAMSGAGEGPVLLGKTRTVFTHLSASASH